jgi:hypothetical protein
MKEKILNKILIFSLFLFIFAISFFIYFVYFKPKQVVGLKINFSGPNEVLSLENYNYQVEVINGSNKKLTDVTFKISLPDGAFLTDNPQEKEISLFIGDLSPNQIFQRKLNLFFINSGNLKETLNFILNYKIENKNTIFAKEGNFSVLVKNSPIKTQIFLPTKAYINQEFQVNFRIINLTKQKLNNIKVNIDVPSYYILTSAFPQGENFYWEFNSLEAGEEKNISLIGQIQNQKSSGIFSIKIDFSFQNFSFSLSKEIAKINILENPIVFYIKSIPENKSLPIGSSLFYEVTLENKSESILENNEVKIFFDGPFDFSSLNSDGYFNQFDKVLYFNSRNKPELLVLKPGDKTKFQFSISLFKSYPILGEQDKNFPIKIRAEFRSKSIPIEIEEGGKEYVIFQEDEKKLSGNYEIENILVYQDPNFTSQGEWPLKPNQPTSLVWHLKIKSIGEDFNNFTLSTKLPIGINFTGKVGGDAILDNLKYDSKTGAFVYQLNKLPANLGYTQKEIDLSFQLIVEMPANIIDINSFIIVPQVEVSAIGDFSQSEVRKILREISVKDVLYK